MHTPKINITDILAEVVLDNRIKVKYLSQTWLRLYVKTMNKKAIFLQNIFSQRKIALKTSIGFSNSYIND